MKNLFLAFAALIMVFLPFSPALANQVECKISQSVYLSVIMNYPLPADSTVKSFVDDVVVKAIEQVVKENGLTYYGLISNQGYREARDKHSAAYIEGSVTFALGGAPLEKVQQVVYGLAKKGYLSTLGTSINYYGANNGVNNCPAATPRTDLTYLANPKEQERKQEEK